ncbi:MAG: CDP-diacylglycerol--glycerol-3-phosphate 3-phosphatidyltransferase [Caulobacteraceae bacterium]|nr:CDP-diacylglycerol--glycerol-3-phosphate 3-phosphatidyltransferase [Caulobacteraceae bacterium]
MRHIPNLLTVLRLVLSVAMFAALLAIGSGRWPAAELALARVSLIAFVVAAVTDFFDGWLARRWKVVSLLGAILDPIADKILVCGAVLGLASVAALAPGRGLLTAILAPSAVILFREFAVSALREVLAPRGVKLPVTFLAKTKTTLQLVAVAALMIVILWPAWGIGASAGRLGAALEVSEGLFALAAAVTLWTGLEYGRSAWLALSGEKSPQGSA